MVITWKEKFNKKYGFPPSKSHTLAEIAKLTGIKLSNIKKIAEKGRGAYYTNPQSVRPLVRRQGGAVRWGIARVYSAVMGGPSTKIDKDLLN